MTKTSNIIGTTLAWHYVAKLLERVCALDADILTDESKHHIASYSVFIANIIKGFHASESDYFLEAEIAEDFRRHKSGVLRKDTIQMSLQKLCSAEGLKLQALSIALGISFFEEGLRNDNFFKQKQLIKKGLFFITQFSQDSKPEYVAQAFISDNPWIQSDNISKIDKHNWYIADEDDTSLVARGRISSIRNHSRISFIDIINQSGKLQFAIAKDSAIDISGLSIGDYIVSRGTWGRSRAGMATFFVSNITNHIPSHASSSSDIIESWEKANAFGELLKQIRLALFERGYIETPTPTLLENYEGGSSRPFRTHENNSGQSRYLKVTSEIHLLRMIAGGAENIFEISPSYRNENREGNSSPEFHMLEAYSVLHDLSEFTDFICGLLRELFDEHLEFETKSMKELYREYFDVDIENRTDLEELISKHIKNVDCSGYESPDLVSLSYHKLLMPKIKTPTLVRDIPTDGSPLIKGEKEDARRVWICIDGMEIGEIAENELRPSVMRESLLKQAAEDPHLVRRNLNNIQDTLQMNIPRVVGVGIGLERLHSVIALRQGIQNNIRTKSFQRRHNAS